MFRIWSAACSSGQEPYTLAMVLHENRLHSFEIYASDLNSTVLAKAKRGVYSETDLRGMLPKSLLNKYWLEGTGPEAGHVRAGKQLRSAVHFFQVNLTENLPDIGKFDVIFLRNVLIYFEEPAVGQIVKRIVNKLTPGGYLMVGHAESLLNYDRFGIEPVASSVYRRKC